MKPRGEDTAAAVRDWVKDEIKAGPGTRQDLGKFFFTVASATVGVLGTLEKLSAQPRIDLPLAISLLALLAAIVISLLMVFPSTLPLTGDTDLYDKYDTAIRQTIWFIWGWFLLWLAGVVPGAFAVID